MKILYFGAVWCPACLIMKPVIKKTADNNSNIEVIYYDYDMDEDMVIKMKVGRILPEMIILDQNDKEIKRIIGEKTKREVEEFINEII